MHMGARPSVQPSKMSEVATKGRRRPLLAVGYFVAVFLVALAPLALVGTYAAVEAHRSNREQTELRMRELSRAMANTVGNEILSRITAAHLIGAISTFDRFPNMSPSDAERLFNRMEDFSEALGNAHISVLTFRDGAPIRVLSTLAPRQVTDSFVLIPEVVQLTDDVLREMRPVVSAPFRSPYTGKDIVLITVPVWRGSEIVAAITVEMRVSRLQAVLETQQAVLDTQEVPDGSLIALTHRRGFVVSRVPQQHIGAPVTAEYQSMTENARSGIFRSTTSLDGRPLLVAFEALSQDNDYIVSVAMPVDVVEAAWRSTLTHLLVAAGVAVVIVIVAIVFSKRLWSRAQADLLDQDAYLNIALGETGLATWESNVYTDHAIWSAAHFDILGYPRHATGRATNSMWQAAVHPDDRGLIREQVAKLHLYRPEGLLRLTYRIVRQDTGEVRWCESIGQYVGQGRIIGVIMDITEARAEQERHILLAREVDHRSKNLLAVVQAMVSMTRAADTNALRSSLAARILSLSKTHTLLAQNQWKGSDIHQVVQNELGARGDVRLDGPHVSLRAEAVQPIAMTLHELATNAAKYGAHSKEGGVVGVTWRLEGNNLIIDWTEDGGPSVTSPTTKGFGSRMIVRVLAQVGGTITVDWQSTGLRAVLTLPMDRISR